MQLRSTPDIQQNVERIIHYLGECSRGGARAVVFPECAVTGYDKQTSRRAGRETLEEAHQRIAAACREHRVYAVVGTPWRDEDDRLLNTAAVFAPDGRCITRYAKIQLAEGWPRPGRELVVFPVDGIWCSVIICHDERYPELVRLPVLAGAQVVFYISHESDVRHERKLDPYRAQIQARAAENGIYVVHANAPANPDASGSHGQSRIVAPDGNVVNEASIFEEEVVTGTLELNRANRKTALRSLESELLGDWWRQGMRLVRRAE